MNCQVCNSIEEREGMIIYTDPHAHVVLPAKPATKGHVRVYSKEHAESFDDLTHEAVQHMFQVGNVVASILFEQLGAEGTNIIVNEGDMFDSHLHMDVVTRSESDNLRLEWDAERADDGVLEQAQKSIKDQADLIGHSEDKKPKRPVKTSEKEKVEGDEENYLTKHLERLP